MADKKISALTGATTPLAGTEVLPIVQSGTTVKVSVANLTAGRSIAASDVTIVGGNGGQLNLDNTGQQYTQITYKNNGVAKAYQFFDNTAAKLQTYSNTGIPFLFSPGGADSLEMSTAGNLNVKQAAKGVNFTANTPAAGMTSQLLNWYEEGTFTPTVEGSSTAGTTTYATQSGWYTRIGRMVHVIINFSVTNMTGTGKLKFGGLPFAANSSPQVPGAIMTNGLDFASGTALTTYCAGGTNFYLFSYGDNIAWAQVPVDTTWDAHISMTYII